MKKAFGVKISEMGLFGSIVGSDANIRIESSASVARYAGWKARRLFKWASVLHIFRHRYITKVGNAIVERVAVDMIDLTLRPLAMHPKPRKAVLAVSLFVDLQDVVPLNTSRDVAHSRFAELHSPTKKASLGIVIQKLAQTISGKFGHGFASLDALGVNRGSEREVLAYRLAGLSPVVV